MSSHLVFNALYVDLSTQTITRQTFPSQDLYLYLGGRGLNAKILYEGVPKETDPLGPKNLLIFSAGKLVGTPVPTAGQVTITAKSPATGFYFKSNVGGAWGKALRRSGWDVLVISGAADRPVYLLIDGDKISVHDASFLWGKSVRETTKEIHFRLGGRGLDVATIGPAGENLVHFATIMTSTYHAAGRGGLGAVMGSKKLKAIAVRGSGITSVENEGALRIEIENVFDKIQKSKKAELYLKYGTAATIEYANQSWSLPVNNFQKSHLDNGDKLGGTYLSVKGYMRNGSACSACPMGCHKFSVVKRGRYKGYSGGPEYETLASLGAGCGITNTEAVLKANELCNDYGLDTISTGGVIQWLIESVERGLLSERIGGGLALRWGNGDTLISLITLIAHRKGIGDLLAKGTKQAAKEVGGDSWRWAVQANGLEQSRIDARVAKGYALAFAVNPRGPDHLYAQPMAEFGFFPEARRLVEKLLGSDRYCDPISTDKKPELVRWHEDMLAVSDSLGICSFSTTTTYVIDPPSLLRMLRATLGVDFTEEELLLAGRRTVVLERCFNLREDRNRRDILPWRIMNDPIDEGPHKGIRTSEDELRTMLTRYYELHGYDAEKGHPTEQTLSSIGLLGDIKGIDVLLNRK